MAKRTAGTARCSMQIGRLSTRLTVGRMERSWLATLTGSVVWKQAGVAGKKPLPDRWFMWSIKSLTCSQKEALCHFTMDIVAKVFLRTIVGPMGQKYRKKLPGVDQEFEICPQSSVTDLKLPRGMIINRCWQCKKLPVSTDIDDVYKLYHTQFCMPASVLNKQMVSVGIYIWLVVKVYK